MDALRNYFGVAPSHEPPIKKTPAKKATKSRAATKKRTAPKAAPVSKSRKKGMKAVVPALVKYFKHMSITLRRNKEPKLTAKNTEKAIKAIDDVRGLPVFYIDAHSCLCPFEGKCLGSDIPPTFRIPKDTFLISFTQAGEATCPNTAMIVKKYEYIRDYLYLHSQGDLREREPIGKTHFSLFSGVRRAVGPIEFPNISFTLNDGKKPRKENPYGVYELSSPQFQRDPNIWQHLNNTLSVLPQDPDRSDWTLQQIIDEVYAKKGISSALFIVGGCLTSCDNPEKANANGKATISANITRHGRLIDSANATYTRARNTFTREELEGMGFTDDELVPNLGTHALQAYPQPSEYAEMMREGLINRNTIKHLPGLVHPENRRALESEFRFKFDSDEGKSKI